MARPIDIDAETVRQMFVADGDTGTLFWASGQKGAGAPVNTISSRGYLSVSMRINGVLKFRRVHRIIWLLCTGDWPKGFVDHINGIRDDNRLSNLRDVSSTENNRNTSLGRTNKSGVIGVCFYKKYSKWMAYIKVNRVSKTIGYYDTVEEAAAARLEAQRKYGFHENHGKIGGGTV